MRNSSVLFFLLFLGQNSFTQAVFKKEFQIHHTVLETHLGTIPDDAITASKINAAVYYMEKHTGIKANPNVTFLFTVPYSRENFYAWEVFGKKNGYL